MLTENRANTILDTQCEVGTMPCGRLTASGRILDWCDMFGSNTSKARSSHGKPRLIQLDLEEMSQLFNSLDPSPFIKRDMDQDAEEFIINWAREYPPSDPITLRIHFEVWPGDEAVPVIQTSVRNFFAYRAKLNELEFHRLMADGRFSLAMGLTALAASIVLSKVVLANVHWAPVGILREGLTIVGWVAMWRPIQIYLHEWWPVRRRGQALKKLSEMPVEVVRKTPA